MNVWRKGKGKESHGCFFLKVIVFSGVIGVAIPITNSIISWQERNIQKDQTETEQNQAEWEQRQKENELAPTIKVDNKATILLGKNEYTKYELYNSENNLAGGKLKEINGVVIVSSGEIRIKTLWVKDAVYDVEVPFDSKQQRATIFYKELGAIKENVAELKKLSSPEYQNISELCYQAYCVLPQGDMATRYGRNAGDALKTGLEEGGNYSQMIKDFNRSYEGYVTSFHYRDCEQKLADGCYWIGDDFYQFLYNYARVTEEQKEHSALMAYLYSFFGDEAANEDGVNHRNDLKNIKKETSRILMEEYDYPIFLFSEG